MYLVVKLTFTNGLGDDITGIEAILDDSVAIQHALKPVAAGNNADGVEMGARGARTALEGRVVKADYARGHAVAQHFRDGLYGGTRRFKRSIGGKSGLGHGI